MVDWFLMFGQKSIAKDACTKDRCPLQGGLEDVPPARDQSVADISYPDDNKQLCWEMIPYANNPTIPPLLKYI